MKQLPGSLLLVAAFCFFIVAFFADAAGAFIVIGCAMLVTGIVLLKRGRTAR